MNSRSPSQARFLKSMAPLAATALLMAAMILALAPSGSSQQPSTAPAWTVFSTDPVHSTLTLRWIVQRGVDRIVAWYAAVRVEGAGVNELSSFQPGQAVELDAPSASQVPRGAMPALHPIGIPTVGQRVVIRASGIQPVEGVVLRVTPPEGPPPTQTPTQQKPAVPGAKSAVPTATPCCVITVINLQTGIVTAKANDSGQMFEFAVANATLLNSLKVGQPVWANFTTGRVSVNGTTACCTMTAEGMPSRGKPKGVGVKGAVGAGQTCCQITNIASATGDVTAKVNSTGQTFQFKVTDASLLKSLKVGQGVYVNFKTRQVSVNGVGPCCAITSFGKAPEPLSGSKSLSARSRRLTPQERKIVLAEARAISTAFRSALNNPGVRQATDLEIRRQLRYNPPLAFVKGYWVVLVDMSRVYAIPTVQAAMVSNLRGTSLASQLPGSLTSGFRGNIPARLGLGFLTTAMANQLGATAVQAAFEDLQASMKDFQSILAGATLGEEGGGTGDPFIDTATDFLDWLEENPATEPYVEAAADFLGDVWNDVTSGPHDCEGAGCVMPGDGDTVWQCDSGGDCTDTGKVWSCDNQGNCSEVDSGSGDQGSQTSGSQPQGSQPSQGGSGGSICGGRMAGMSCASGASNWAGWAGSGFIRTSPYGPQISQLVGLTGAAMQQAVARGRFISLSSPQAGQVNILVVH